MLARAGHRGEFVQLIHDPNPFFVEPLPVSFEPVEPGVERRRVDELAFKDNPDGIEIAEKVRRHRQWPGLRVFVTSLLVALVFVIMFLSGVAVLLATIGKLISPLAVLAMLAAIPCYAIYRGLRNRRGPQWLAVPGGVVLRDRKGVMLFDRRNSNLVLFPLPRFFCRIGVGHAEAQFATTLPAEAAYMISRAWLSPVEPPSVEQLAEFA